MPPKSKSKNALPNQHSKRHESGLVPPGKRVTQINGHSNGKLVPSVVPPTGLNQGYKFADSAESAQQAVAKDHAVPQESAERDRTYSDASLDEGGQYVEMGDIQLEQDPLAPGVEAQTQAFRSNAPNRAGTTLSTISTILSYYPLRDAISILILLLSLPSTLVLVIQTLFASLTFVPPTASISLSTLPNVKEMFNSPNLGYPALATILIVDLLFFLCWLPVWKPVQAVFLDLSQAVIAVSLSGAAASTDGPTYSIATTTVIVCIVHVLRYKAIHLTALDYLRSVIHKMDVGIQLDVPSFATSFASIPPVGRGWLYTVTRTILGIHIVSQGVTTCIRRSLVKANEQSAHIPAISKSDPEAAAGSEATAKPNTVLAEAAQHAATGQSTDGRPPGPSPARDGKTRESVTKKKRKQANQVRSQQPLWAAIASTKVTFIKEMEQRDAADDARDAARLNTNTTNMTTSNTISTTNHIWICEVRDSEIFFSVELSAAAAMENADGLEDGTNVHAGIDKSKPFYVRINGAVWRSTRINASASEDTSTNIAGDRYEGEIFGLAPLSSYHCEVVGIGSQNVLCAVSIVTQPTPTAEQAVSASSQPAHQTLRPASPITTLKQSIMTAENKLSETRNRTRKVRKDQRAAHADIKREINMLKAKLDASGGNDDKQEKRITQITQHKTQAEEAAAELKIQIDAMGEIPETDAVQSEAKRSKWQSAANAKRAADKDIENAKAEAERELNALKSDITQTESKREKLAARLTQRHQELDKLMSRQQADMTAKQKREFDRAQMSQRREQEETELRSHIAAFESEAEVFQRKSHDAYQQMAALQSWTSSAPPPYPGYSSPPTPDNALPGANGSLGSPQSNGFPAFGPHPFQSPFHSAQPSISQTQSGPRGRSSSMLSQYSGFTEPGDDQFFSPEQTRSQYSWPVQPSAIAGAPTTGDRKESESSGSQPSASTGSNSPRPDAKPFFPGKGSGVGLIGPPSRSPKSPVSSLGAIGSGR